MGEEKFNSIGKAVQKAIDEIPSGSQFYGSDLKRMVVDIYPDARGCYVETVMRKARLYRRTSYKIINYAKSLYEKV